MDMMADMHEAVEIAGGFLTGLSLLGMGLYLWASLR
jgi:hypothetical protein